MRFFEFHRSKQAQEEKAVHDKLRDDNFELV